MPVTQRLAIGARQVSRLAGLFNMEATATLRLPVAMACLIVSSAAPLALGLLANPGFEDVDGAGTPVGWTFYVGAGVTNDAHSGTNAVRVRGGVYYSEYVAQDLPIEPNRCYRISCWVKRESQGVEAPRLRCYFYDSGGGLLNSVTDTLYDTTTQYRPYHVSAMSPPGAHTMRIRLDGMYYGHEWFLFDDVDAEASTVDAMPGWEDAPDLNGRSLYVAHIADVYGFGVLPHVNPWYGRMNPFDGKPYTASWTRRAYYVREPPNPCAFRITLIGAPTVSWLSIHSTSLHKVADADLVRPSEQSWDQDEQTLLAIRGNEKEVILKQLPSPVSLSRLRLDVFSNPDENVAINELQFFSILDDAPANHPGQDPHFLNPIPLAGFDYQPHVEQCFPAPADQTVLVSQSGASGSLDLAGGHYVSLFGPQVSVETGCRGVRLNLGVASTETNNVLEICVKRGELFDRDYQNPENRQLADLCRVYTKVSTPVIDAVIRVPTFLLQPGERVWVTLRPLSDLSLDLTTTQMAVLTCSQGEGEQEMAMFYLREAIRMFAFGQGSIVQDYVERAHTLNPDSGEAEDMLNSLAGTRPEVVLTLPDWAPATAPEWAVWACQAVRADEKILHWWIDERQVANGELGGDFNDDVELTAQWPFFYLITGDTKVQDALRRIADGAWEYNVETGYGTRMPDVEHAAEDTLCTQPQMLLADYGDPLYVERLLKMSSYLPDFWTGTDNACNRRLFRSCYFTATGIDDRGPDEWPYWSHNVDHVYSGLVMAAPYYAAWYAGMPQPRGWFLEWAQSWLDATMSTECGKPAGVIPIDLHYPTCEIGHYSNCDWADSTYYDFGHYCIRQALFAAYMTTKDPAYLEPFHLQYTYAIADPPGLSWRRVTGDTTHDSSVVARADRRIQCFNTPGCTNYSSYNQDNLTLLYAWEATGDKFYLVEMLKELNRQQHREGWLLTEPVAETDGVSIPGAWSLPFVYLGGNAGAAKAGYPHLAVSYEGGGTDLAALVLENDVGHVKLLLYNFAETPRSVTVRFWELEYGTYEVVMGPDLDEDDQMDGVTFRVEPDPVLWRHQGAALPVPSQQLQIIRVQQVQAFGDPVQDRGDLVISSDDLSVSPDGTTLTVYVRNLGAAEVPVAEVRLIAMDAGGVTLDSASVENIQPPVDALPPVPRVVTLDLVGTGGQLAVHVDPDNLVPEIVETNNRVEFPSGHLLGDFDRNGFVDGDDFVVFLSCASGPTVPHEISDVCLEADFDRDNDVDQADFGVFQRSYTGSSQTGG